MLAVPSFIPIRLRGVSWLRLVVAVRPKPSWDQRIATVPRPMRARLRIAWKATWGSSEQAWTQISPPLSAGSSSSPGSGGSGRVFTQQVEGGEVEAGLGGRVDPRLGGAIEGDAAGALAARVRGLLTDEEPPGGAEPKPSRARTGGGQQAAAG